MAYCPECKGEMATGAIECPHCGYALSQSDNTQTEFVDSPLADLLLLVLTRAWIIGIFGTVIGSVVGVLSGELALLFLAPIAILFQMSLLVVFLRAQR